MGIETALIAAVNAGLMTAGTGASIGTALSFLPAASTVFGTLQGLSSIMGGIQGMQAGKQQASLAMQQAALQGAESERQAQREARFEQQNVDSTIRRQKVAYLKSGVTLEGSPLLVMEETRRKGAENIEEILQGGAYASRAAQQEGRIRASNYKSSGRQSFINGLIGGGKSLYGVFA